ncbi:MAG: thioredoxin domain-containing protein [Gallionella sp.]
MKQKTIFVVAAVFLLLIFGTGVLLYTIDKEGAANQLAETNRTSLIRMHSPTLGKSDAPVTIVEFLDPACETCRKFYPLVKQIMADNPDKIRIVLRYAPFHAGSDKVVAMLEAARKQGKFWEALEILLSFQSGWTKHHTANPEAAWQVLRRIGLDMAQMNQDMNSTETANVIAQDLADAKTLNVTMTPEFFVNGKPLPSFGFDQLKALVDEAVEESGGR